MFEHFGLKDAFWAIWRYKILIFCFGLILAFLGGIIISKTVVNSVPAELSPDLVQDEEKDISYYEVKNQFYLEYYGDDKSITSQALSQMYLNTFQSYSCNQFVNEYILSRMSKEEIIKRLKVDYTPEEIGFDYFEQFIQGTVDTESGQAFTLLVRSGDVEYASLVVDAYMQWIYELASHENSQVGIVTLDKSIESSTLFHMEKQTVLESKNLSKRVVSIIFFFVAVIVLSVVVMGIRLFVPTLNCKSDFEEYGIAVLGELRR